MTVLCHQLFLYWSNSYLWQIPSFILNLYSLTIIQSYNNYLCNLTLFIPPQQVARVAQSVRSLDLTAHISLSPIRRGFAPSFVNYKKGCTRLAAASDKVYQLLAQGQWFSPGTPASSTTKTGGHDVAEILLKVALKHQKFKFKFLLCIFQCIWPLYDDSLSNATNDRVVK